MPTRDDPSLGLLRSLTVDALDPDYEIVARRDRGSAPDGGAGGHHSATALVLLLVAFLLLLGGAVGIRQTRSGVDSQRDQLRQRVTDQIAATDAKSTRTQDLRDEVARLTAASEPGVKGGGLSDLELVTGATPVQGPGVRIVMTDAPESDTPNAASDPQLGRVLDVDVQTAVNGLWAAGAEAVAVNGQRLTSLSSIRSAGEAILVNYRPLSPPYVIEGIGDPNTLQSSFVGGPSGRALEAASSGYGLGVDVTTQDRLVLPAASTTLRSLTAVKP